jgi:hypothetical protein
MRVLPADVDILNLKLCLYLFTSMVVRLEKVGKL